MDLPTARRERKTMKRPSALMLFGLTIWLPAISACGPERDGTVTPEIINRGSALFSQFCSGCHPDGGNAIRPQKSLHRIDLKANGITSAAGIVAKMRSPEQGMKRFDRKTIPDQDALAIAHYIIATF